MSRSFDPGLSRPIVNTWRQRFRKSGLAGLKDAVRSGKPSTITVAQKAMVIVDGLRKPIRGNTDLAQKRIGEQVGSNQRRVHRILTKET